MQAATQDCTYLTVSREKQCYEFGEGAANVSAT